MSPSFVADSRGAKQFDTPPEARLQRMVTGGFVVAMLLTVFMGFLSWHSAQLTADEADWVGHTYAVMDTLELTSRHVIEAETSAQAFAVTGRETSLAYYQGVRNAIAQDEDTLHRLTADNPGQQQRLREFRMQVDDTLQFAESVVAKRHHIQGIASASEVVVAERLMDTVRASAQELHAAEMQLLTERVQRTRAAWRLTEWLLVVGVLVGVGLLALARLAVTGAIGASAQAGTQIVTLNAGLQQRTAQLERANKELEAFSYSVSHDLRAPLRHISGFSKILTEEFGPTLDPSAQRYLERIQAGAKKMGLLVDELLNLARVGRHALSLQPTRFNPIVDEVIAILRPDSEGRQVEWVIADLPEVECDAILVKQIFQNLLANALKFTRPCTHAVIEVSYKEKPDGGGPVFMVRDNGVGFSMKYVDNLFGVFQRLHSADEFEGTGIGLATVQRIVHRHGGRVWAEGEIDKGAAFYFTLGRGKQVESKSRGATAGGQS
jgi:signal transduction histidine kinase